MTGAAYQPLIIIGAPRSGTNMLRDVLCRLDGVGSWPCDEINYIWRHGNMGAATDEFDPGMATDRVKKYIRHKFDEVAKKQQLDVVVEKTCANSLRIPFVDTVIPDARYIFIYRDGIDVVASAVKRWKARLDLPYLMKKARYVPLLDLPFYALRYFANRMFRIFSGKRRLAFWGPKYANYEKILSTFELEEVCAHQWKSCIESSEKALIDIPSNRFARVSYEVFVSDPCKELSRVLLELKIDFDEKLLYEATGLVSDKSVGKGARELGEDKCQRVQKIISDTLVRYGYG